MSWWALVAVAILNDGVGSPLFGSGSNQLELSSVGRVVERFALKVC